MIEVGVLTAVDRDGLKLHIPPITKTELLCVGRTFQLLGKPVEHVGPLEQVGVFFRILARRCRFSRAWTALSKPTFHSR